MQLDDKIFYLLVGGAIGFLVGYVVRSLREIKEEVHVVKEAVDPHSTNERGAMRIPRWQDLALLGVVVLVVWAAFSSQAASNAVKDQQGRVEMVTRCNQTYLNRTIVALNERTTYSTEQSAANVDLQKAQARYLGLILVRPPLSSEATERALNEYVDALTKFVDLATRSLNKTAGNPYPTPEELSACLMASQED